MRYRQLGKTKVAVSEIGLGTEYLIGASRETIISVVREGYHRGVNYIDLLYVSPGYRDNFSAAFNGIRDKLIIAGHIGVAEIDGQYNRTRDQKIANELFHDMLTRLRTDYIDVLMLHYVDSENLDELAPGGLYDLAARFKEEGKARFIGISSHKVPIALKAVRTGKIDVIMFPVNLARDAKPEVKEFHNECERLGIGVIAMKPYGGGKLLWGNKELGITPAQCLNYVLAQKAVASVVPGVNNNDEWKKALEFLDLPETDKDFSHLIGERGVIKIEECLFCNHCLPCPESINIGMTIRILEMARHGALEKMIAAYKALPTKASACIECGVCMKRCFLDVNVIAKMRAAKEMFEV